MIYVIGAAILAVALVFVFHRPAVSVRYARPVTFYLFGHEITVAVTEPNVWIDTEESELSDLGMKLRRQALVLLAIEQGKI